MIVVVTQSRSAIHVRDNVVQTGHCCETNPDRKTLTRSPPEFEIRTLSIAMVCYKEIADATMDQSNSNFSCVMINSIYVVMFIF